MRFEKLQAMMPLRRRKSSAAARPHGYSIPDDVLQRVLVQEEELDRQTRNGTLGHDAVSGEDLSALFDLDDQ